MTRKSRRAHYAIHNEAETKRINITMSLLKDKTYLRAYDELREIQTARQNHDESLTITAIQCGCNYERNSLIVYNRFSTGADNWTGERIMDVNWLQKVFTKTHPSTGYEYNPKKSSFLRTSKALGESLFADDWWRYICLSNLYKLTSSDEDVCSDKIFHHTTNQNAIIFKRELEILKPRHAVLLTGYEWAKEFLFALSNKQLEPISIFFWGENRFIYNYIWNGIQIIISDPPKGNFNLSEAIIHSIHYHNI